MLSRRPQWRVAQASQPLPEKDSATAYSEMGRTEKRRCLNCGELFTPEARNARHQRYCPALPCKAASKRASLQMNRA